MSEESPRIDAREAVELARRSPVHPLELPRLVGNVLADIRTIAEGMATLPKMLTALNSIEARVDTLNEEVHKMRTRVDGMAGDVSEVRAGIERVEPALQDVTNVVHPLRRIGERAARRREPGAGA